MLTKIKRVVKNENSLTMTMQALTLGKLLATLQALRDSKSKVAYDVYCSIRNEMQRNSDIEIREAVKIFEEVQKNPLTLAE